MDEEKSTGEEDYTTKENPLATGWLMSTYEPPVTVSVVNSDESTQMYIFPHGPAAFARKYNADVIQIETDFVWYYHGPSQKWKSLDYEDETVERRGNVASIRKGPDKHQP